MFMKKDFYTVSEAALELNVSQTTVYNWVRAGKISTELRQLGLAKIQVISQEELDKFQREKK